MEEAAGRVEYRDEGPVRVVRLIPPPDGCMRAPMTEALIGIIGEAAADENVRALVLTGGRPGYFIQHYWVEDLVRWGDEMRAVIAAGGTLPEATTVAFHTACRLLETMDKPVIAALTGNCMGGGFELALACDTRVAQEGRYSIGLIEANIGLLPAGGGTQRLSRLIGPSRAFMLIAAGRAVPPAEALRLGLVDEVADDAEATAIALAQRIAGRPAGSVAAVKRLCRHIAPATGIEAGIEEEQPECQRLWIGDEAMRLMRAFCAGEFDIRDGEDGHCQSNCTGGDVVACVVGQGHATPSQTR